MAIDLTKQQAHFLLACIQYADRNYPRVDLDVFDTVASDLIERLREIVNSDDQK